MKRFMVLIVFISLLTFLTACSSKPSLELVNANVDIINDKRKLGSKIITEGDNKGQELVPTALYYEFTIKNTWYKKIGGFGDKGLKIQIEPNNNLVTTSNEIIGFNIFNPSEYEASGMGYGFSFRSDLKRNEEGKYTLNYDLGVSEENSQYPLLVPPKEQLKKLKDNALDATLIVILDDKEIAHFDLKNK